MAFATISHGCSTTANGSARPGVPRAGESVGSDVVADVCRRGPPAGAALVALGGKPPTRLHILGANRPELVIFDVGAWPRGHPRGIYTTSSPSECAYITSTTPRRPSSWWERAQLQKRLGARPAAQPPARGHDARESVTTRCHRVGRRSWPAATARRSWTSASPDCARPVSTLIYPSGTTGSPRRDAHAGQPGVDGGPCLRHGLRQRGGAGVVVPAAVPHRRAMFTIHIAAVVG